MTPASWELSLGELGLPLINFHAAGPQRWPGEPPSSVSAAAEPLWDQMAEAATAAQDILNLGSV